jgi:hypothetical protein
MWAFWNVVWNGQTEAGGGSDGSDAGSATTLRDEAPRGSRVIFRGYGRFPELRHGVWLWWGARRWPPSGIDYISGSASGAFSFLFEGSVGMLNGVVIHGVYMVLKVCLIWVLHMWLI